MGNSEVGHLNIGAGRMVPQDQLRIDLSLRNGSFFANPALLAAARHAREAGGTLHLMGLLSDGGVHSQQRHLHALLELAAREKVPRTRVHAFTDGRDTAPRSAHRYVDALQEAIARWGGAVATVSGRYYAMDRDGHWERVAKAYAALVSGRGRMARDPVEAVATAYSRDESDEFIEPTVIAPGGEPIGRIADGDALVFFNFRADRARQLTRALTETAFTEFRRDPAPILRLVSFTEYKREFSLPIAFPTPALRRILGEVWGERALPNLRLAETEKYAHVTYFFNGGVEPPYPAEERILVPSWRGATYDLHPEMSAADVTRELKGALASNRFDAFIVNFANADMVGHTGKLPETIRAVEVLDTCLREVEAAADRHGALVVMTADHGNAEQMIDTGTGQPHTAHTVNPVPFVVCRAGAGRLRSGGNLADVAPTLLALQRLPVPKEMTGRDLRGP